MKKILYAAMSAFMLLGLFSCDLQRDPDGQDDQKDYFASLTETKQFRDGLYSVLRGAENPERFVWQDFQSDMFAVTTNDGNTSSRFVTWSLGHMESSDEIASYYLAYYTLLQQANYFVGNIERTIERGIYTTDAQVTSARMYRAEGLVMQALALSRLMERFAYKYDPNAAASPQNLGVVLVKGYEPFSSAPRNTQTECYQYILDRLGEAIEVLPAKSTEGNIRISKNFALALRSRVNLNMGNYSAAIPDAQAVVDAYPLIDATTAAAFEKIYRSDDDNPELVFRGYASSTIGTTVATTINGAFANATYEVLFSPIAAPFQWVVDQYQASDFRKSVYISKKYYTLPGVKAYMVTKHLGNPAYRTNPNVHDFKVASRFFSVAEAYLILAESKAKTGDESGAKAVLTTLSQKRGAVLEDGAAMDLVMAERNREMIGEGSRLNDMLRWNLPNNHDDMENQPDLVDAGVAKNDKLKQAVPAGHFAFTWEIPLRDRQVNPQILKNWPI
ncbi:RagB/SusD family nutrient uptake outer membrane protein [Porphyromonas loveana]|uniref:RagB/SusD family nutrient uptake outer membrane protein n=1 Tax=Porphyromonas loveana TaxID=1884669 RepID=UPI0035A08C1C